MIDHNAMAPYLLEKINVIKVRSKLMRKTIVLLIAIVSYLNFLAVTPQELIKIKPTFKTKYTPHGITDTTMEVPVRFDESHLLYTDRIKILNARAIKRVTLYYTIYKESTSFSQPELNLDRFQNLQAVFPSLFFNSFIEWRVIGQTAPANAEEARKLFHGFVFEFFPVPTAASIKREIKTIEKLMSSKELGEDSAYTEDAYYTKQKRVWSGMYLPKSKRRRHKGVVCEKKGVWNRQKQWKTEYTDVEYKVSKTKFAPSFYAKDFVYKHTQDTSVFSIMNRNNNWNDMVFVVDVTGSMSPYTSQLFVWYKLNASKRHVKNFTFFNDGDSKSDGKKKVGETGGIYSSEATAADDVMKAGQKVMERGGGGDAPENNIEATLKALEKNPEAKEIFMIADNYANMRDQSLISKITVPVHVFLCGVSGGHYNTQYLDLARRTGGSVHTLDQDITDLMKLSEGETIKIGGETYKIKHGKFELCYKF